MNCLRLTKTNSKYDRIEFVQDGRVIAKVDNPKQGILPHDFIHAIVESKFGIRGFTDMVFEAQSPQYAMEPDGEAWLAEAMVESIQGMLWSGQLDHTQFNVWVERICSQRKVPSFKSTPQQFLELELAIEEAATKWNLTDKGGLVEFPWPH